MEKRGLAVIIILFLFFISSTIVSADPVEGKCPGQGRYECGCYNDNYCRKFGTVDSNGICEYASKNCQYDSDCDITDDRCRPACALKQKGDPCKAGYVCQNGACEFDPNQAVGEDCTTPEDEDNDNEGQCGDTDCEGLQCDAGDARFICQNGQCLVDPDFVMELGHVYGDLQWESQNGAAGNHVHENNARFFKAGGLTSTSWSTWVFIFKETKLKLFLGADDSVELKFLKDGNEAAKVSYNCNPNCAGRSHDKDNPKYTIKTTDALDPGWYKMEMTYSSGGSPNYLNVKLQQTSGTGDMPLKEVFLAFNSHSELFIDGDLLNSTCDLFNHAAWNDTVDDAVPGKGCCGDDTFADVGFPDPTLGDIYCYYDGNSYHWGSFTGENGVCAVQLGLPWNEQVYVPGQHSSTDGHDGCCGDDDPRVTNGLCQGGSLIDCVGLSPCPVDCTLTPVIKENEVYIDNYCESFSTTRMIGIRSECDSSHYCETDDDDCIEERKYSSDDNDKKSCATVYRNEKNDIHGRSLVFKSQRFNDKCLSGAECVGETSADCVGKTYSECFAASSIGCEWQPSGDVFLSDGLKDLGFGGSNSRYLCLNDHDAGSTPDIKLNSDWKWWDAKQQTNAFLIHTVSFNLKKYINVVF